MLRELRHKKMYGTLIALAILVAPVAVSALTFTDVLVRINSGADSIRTNVFGVLDGEATTAVADALINGVATVKEITQGVSVPQLAFSWGSIKCFFTGCVTPTPTTPQAPSAPTRTVVTPQPKPVATPVSPTNYELPTTNAVPPLTIQTTQPEIVTKVIQNTILSTTDTTLDAKLATLRAELLAELSRVRQTTSNNYQAISVSNRIDSLTDTTLVNPTIRNAVITGTSLGATSGSFSGTLSVTGTSTFSGDALFDTDTLTIDSLNNRVGIGTTSPSDTLAINGAIYLANTSPAETANRLYASSGSLYYAGSLIGGASTGNWDLASGNVYRTTGNVGIGTTSPYAKLSVVGEVVASHFTATSTTATSTFVNISSQMMNGCYNADRYASIQAAITAAGATGCVVLTPYTTTSTTTTWYNPSAITIVDQRPTTRAGQFLGGGSTQGKLVNFFRGDLSDKKVVYLGNSTVWAATSWFSTMARETLSGGVFSGMTVRTDMASLSADASENVTVVMDSAVDFSVGEFVSIAPTNAALNACIGSGVVSAVSGTQFTFTFASAGTCANIASTATGGSASQQLLNFGSNGATLTAILADTSATGIGIGGVCAAQPDLLIIRGPLINDVRLGATSLNQAIARERQLLDTIRSCSPDTDILLKTENPLLTTDVGSLGYVSPNSSAQAYSTILRDAITHFSDLYPNVVVLDTQTLLYGTTSPSTSTYMTDQLHPSGTGQVAEANLDIQMLQTLKNNTGFSVTAGIKSVVSAAIDLFSPHLAKNARSQNYTSPWTTYSHECADPEYYTLITTGLASSGSAGQSYFDFTSASTTAGLIQAFDVVEQQSAGCWRLSRYVGASATGNNTRVNLQSGGGSDTTPYALVSGEVVNIWRPKYAVEVAESYVKNTTTYPYRRRVYISGAGSGYFDIVLASNEKMNAASSAISTSDTLVLSTSGVVALSNCSSLAAQGANLRCLRTGDWTAYGGQFGWVFGTHPYEGEPDSSGKIIVGGTRLTSPAMLAVQGLYSGTTPLFDVAMMTSSTATSSMFRISSSGNVGLGTTSPYAKLSVVGETVSSYFSATSTTATSTFAGAVGIGSTSPFAKFSVTGGAVLFDGTTGATPTSGGGTRFMWVPSKYALRAGGVATTRWDDANIGNYSTAFGYNSIASGVSSFAVGDANQATGANSVALGITSNATGDNSFAAGNGSTASGVNSVALGRGGLASGLEATAFGGRDSTASGDYSVSIGRYVQAAHQSAFALGLGVDSSNKMTTTEASQFAIGFGGTVPQFILNGSTGNVGLGTTSPYAKLSVAGNVVADAFVATSTTATSTFAYDLAVSGNIHTGKYIGLTGATSSARPYNGDLLWRYSSGLVIDTGVGRDLYFNADNNTRMFIESTTGAVGIGTTTPVSTLSVQGSLCVRDTGSCGTTAGTIYATTAAISDIDLAENYPTNDRTLAAGEIVAIDTTDTAPEAGVSRAEVGNTVLGIVSTAPGLLLGKEFTNSVPVALSGRVPVKVSLEGGAIKKGDRITLSSTPGVGQKATTSTYTVGIALDTFNEASEKDEHGIGKVLVFVNLAYSRIDPVVADGSLLTTTSTAGSAQSVTGSAFWNFDDATGRLNFVTPLNLNNFDIVGVRAIRSATNQWSIDEAGKLVVGEVKTNKLCVGETCVDEPILKRILDFVGVDAVQEIVDTSAPTKASDPAPASDPEPVTEELSPAPTSAESAPSEAVIEEVAPPAVDPEPESTPEVVVEPEPTPAEGGSPLVEPVVSSNE